MRRTRVKYYNRDTFWKQLRYVSHVKVITGLLAFALIGSAAFIAADIFVAQGRDQSQPTQLKTSVYGASAKHFDSPYFSLTTYDSWKQVTEESTPSKYVYRSYNGKMVNQSLTIYINTIPQDLNATRVIPVSQNADGSFTPYPISRHCKAVFSQGVPLQVKVVSLDRTSFPCWPDDSRYRVLVSERDGTYILRRTVAGKRISYVIYFDNLTATPQDVEMQYILNNLRMKL